MADRNDAKKALDALISKTRLHFYKPIQIAEILYHDRIHKDVNLSDVETYRTKSKQWRDEITLPLLGRVCTSTAKFQDNLFEPNAIPPTIIHLLGRENRRTDGAVESYIYHAFMKKYFQLSKALEYCVSATKENFDVARFIDSFWQEPGLKRSLDKIYEIIVYSLFLTLIDALALKVEVSVAEDSYPLLVEFEDFSKKVAGLSFENCRHVQEAKIYRVGVTNAADRGLDMYANWGPAIQVKHISLNEAVAEDIVTSIASDRVVIICKDAEERTISNLMRQIGWMDRIQSIITESELVSWYEKALRGKYSDLTGTVLIETLCEEISLEFPSLKNLPPSLRERHYENIKDPFWK